MSDDRIQRELEITRVTNDDLGQLGPLFEACFGQAVGQRYFEWKFLRNPAGTVLAYKASHRDRIVAFYGVIPEPWKANGVAVGAWQSMDTMTHPDYQRRRLFVTLATQTYALLEATDPNFLLVGLPGPMSYSGLVDRLGWRDAGRYPAMFGPAVIVRALGKRVPPRVRVRRVLETLPELSNFLRSRTNTLALDTDFTPEFFQWRVFDTPTKRFFAFSVEERDEVVGLCVAWVDPAGWTIPFFLDFANPDNYARLTPFVLREVLAATRGSKIYAWQPRGPERQAGYRAAGLRVNPTGRGPMTYSQPLTVLSPTWSFHGIDVVNPDAYDFQPLLQD